MQPLNLQNNNDEGKDFELVKWKKKKFPFNNAGTTRTTKILPSHRLIYENYENNNFKSLGKAIRQTGVYSEHVANRVNVITKSKSWKALMDEKLPEDKLALRHSELLDKRDNVKLVDEYGNETIVDNGPNTAAVGKGLELAYKLRGSFNEKEAPKQSTVMYNLFYKPEVREQMKTFEDSLKNTLIHEVAKKNQKDIEEEQEAEEQQRIIDAEFTDTGADNT